MSEAGILRRLKGLAPGLQGSQALFSPEPTPMAWGSAAGLPISPSRAAPRASWLGRSQLARAAGTGWALGRPSEVMSQLSLSLQPLVG